MTSSWHSNLPRPLCLKLLPLLAKVAGCVCQETRAGPSRETRAPRGYALHARESQGQAGCSQGAQHPSRPDALLLCLFWCPSPLGAPCPQATVCTAFCADCVNTFLHACWSCKLLWMLVPTPLDCTLPGDTVCLPSSERKEGKEEKGQTGRKKGRKGRQQEGRIIAACIYRMTIHQVVCTFLFSPPTTRWGRHYY